MKNALNIQGSAKTHYPFDFLVPQGQMSRDAVGVSELGVAGNLVVSSGTRVTFGGLDERSADAPSLQGGLHVPALDERHW